MVRALLSASQDLRNTQQLVYASSKLFADQQKADLSVAINGVSDDVSTLEGTVDAHTAELADHETRISALEGP